MPTVRPALPTDSTRLAALYAQLAPNPQINVLPERTEQISANSSTALFVIEHDGRVEGTALVGLCADAMFGFQPFAVVENVIIDEACRGRGLGASLLRHVEAFCLGKDCSKIMLLSSAQRANAHRFFERAGFAGDSKRGFVKYRRQFQA